MLEPAVRICAHLGWPASTSRQLASWLLHTPVWNMSARMSYCRQYLMDAESDGLWLLSQCLEAGRLISCQ